MIATVSAVVAIGGGLLAISGAAAFFLGHIKAKTAAQTIENYKKLRESDENLQNSYEKRLVDNERKIAALEERDAEKALTIAHLESQVETYKSMPLTQISETLATLSESNARSTELSQKLLENQTHIMQKFEIKIEEANT